MELKIKNGDYVAGTGASLVHLAGSEELLQRVLYKLTARREGFPFLPELGSTLYRLGGVPAKERASAAEMAVRQALGDEPELEVSGVELTGAGEGLYCLRVNLSYRGEELEVALTVQ